MSSVTFITAVAPYHTDLLPLAVESVKRQTAPCEHVIIHDTHMRGAGWARNQGLAQVRTDFTAFLDSDDTIAPEFAAHTLAAFDGTHYIYTDFIYDGEVVQSPDMGHFIEGNNQIITALIPTIWLHEIGGFDETLPGAEDTKLFLSLQAARRCGKRLAEPLFNYGKAGRRAKEFMHSPHVESTMNAMLPLRREAMSCCGENEDMPQVVAQPGDVLARALWAGNRAIQGKVTGRWYPRTGNGKIESVHPSDVAAMPRMWQYVEAQQAPQPFVPGQGQQPLFQVAKPVVTVEQAANAIFGVSPNRVMTAEELRAVQPAKVQPDVSRVQTLLAKAHQEFAIGVGSETKSDLVPMPKSQPAPKNKGGRPRKGSK